MTSSTRRWADGTTSTQRPSGDYFDRVLSQCSAEAPLGHMISVKRHSELASARKTMATARRYWQKDYDEPRGGRAENAVSAILAGAAQWDPDRAHIPAFDDIAPTRRADLAMARREVWGGVGEVAASAAPHRNAGLSNYSNNRASLGERRSSLTSSRSAPATGRRGTLTRSGGTTAAPTASGEDGCSGGRAAAATVLQRKWAANRSGGGRQSASAGASAAESAPARAALVAQDPPLPAKPAATLPNRPSSSSSPRPAPPASASPAQPKAARRQRPLSPDRESYLHDDALHAALISSATADDPAAADDALQVAAAAAFTQRVEACEPFEAVGEGLHRTEPGEAFGVRNVVREASLRHDARSTAASRRQNAPSSAAGRHERGRTTLGGLDQAWLEEQRALREQERGGREAWAP